MHRGHNESDPQELELQVVVNHLRLGLGTELGSSAGEVSSLSHRDISPAPSIGELFNIKIFDLPSCHIYKMGETVLLFPNAVTKMKHTRLGN